jgi:hypothetical protein
MSLGRASAFLLEDRTHMFVAFLYSSQMIRIDEDIIGGDSYVPQSPIDAYYTLGYPFYRIFLETIQRENHIAIRIAQGSGID